MRNRSRCFRVNVQVSRSFDIQRNFNIPFKLIVSNLHIRKYSDFQSVLNKVSCKSRFSLDASEFRNFETSRQLPSTKCKAALLANNYIQFFTCISEIVETYHSEKLYCQICKRTLSQNAQALSWPSTFFLELSLWAFYTLQLCFEEA